jgi:hypothetical protein
MELELNQQEANSARQVMVTLKDMIKNFNIRHNGIYKIDAHGMLARFYVAYVTNEESIDSDVLFYDLESALAEKPAIFYADASGQVRGLFTGAPLTNLSELSYTGHGLAKEIEGII